MLPAEDPLAASVLRSGDATKWATTASDDGHGRSAHSVTIMVWFERAARRDTYIGRLLVA